MKIDKAIAGNREAEIAVVYLALTADGLFGDLLKRVEPRDFYYDDCRFVFSEVVEMHAAGLPLCDKAAQASWFKRNEVQHRAKKAKLDSMTAGEILEMVIGGEFASVANLEWYISELRRWRIVRGLRLLSLDFDRTIDEREPLDAIAWMEDQLSKLKKVAAPLADKALELVL